MTKLLSILAITGNPENNRKPRSNMSLQQVYAFVKMPKIVEITYALLKH